MMRGTIEKRFDTKVAAIGVGCWLWTAGRAKCGYGILSVGSRSNESRATIYAHRISWEIHCGPIPDGLQVLHHCDIPLCVNPEHLFLGTQADNMADMASKGRSAHGELSGGAKLRDEEIFEIRSLARAESQREIARRFGVNQSTISRIVNFKNWVLT